MLLVCVAQEVVERASTELGPLRSVDPADFLPRFAAQLPFGQPRGGSRYSDGSDGVSANVRPRTRLRFHLVVCLLPSEIQTPSRPSRMFLLVWPQENRFTPESPGNKARRLKGASLQDLQGMQPVVLHLRALQDGVDRDAVNATMNDNDPKSALIRLIMQEAELSRAHQRNVGVQQSEVQRLPAA
eukprot:COSAG04_NODE_11066_length_733_cov_0.960568_1_plen_184_part_10